MTQLESLVDDFISGALDTKMRPEDMDKILVNYYGYTLPKRKKKNSHRTYFRKGWPPIYVVIDHPGSGYVKDYKVREARKKLESRENL